MWWHSTRDRLVPLLLWKRWGALFLTIGVVAAIAALVKDSASSGDFASIVSKLALSLGAIMKARDVLKSFRVWRWLRPSYRGLDDFTRRLDSSQLFSRAFMTTGPGETSIDVRAYSNQISTLLPRIEFVGPDPTLCAFAARINADAFRGTAYHGTMAEKQRRNMPLSTLQPKAFALIRSEHGSYDHAGLSVVLPMNSQGLAAYLSGKLSDNNIATRHLARRAECPEALLVFLIANARTGSAEKKSKMPDMLDALVQACILQIIILGTESRRYQDIRVIVANADPKWGAAFKHMNFVQCPEYDSADQQSIFESRVTFKNVGSLTEPLLAEKPRSHEECEAYAISTGRDRVDIN